MNGSPAIKAENLSKVFGDNIAVDNLNLEIKKGELFGLVGPDGAGKTTTIRLLTSIMEPSSGNGWIGGQSILKDGERIKEKIGYMSQRFGLYEDLTVMENINFYADLYEVQKKERSTRIERLLGFSNLAPFKDRLAGKLSGGMKQKLGLACTLIHTPEVLFLDEPTNGVDPVSRRDFWKILYDLLREEITIFVSTSYLDEAERCSSVGLMHKGKLLVVDKPDRIKRSHGLPMVELWVTNTRAARLVLQGLEGVVSVNNYGDKLHMSVRTREAIPEILGLAHKSGIAITSHRELLPSLEDIFIARVKG